MINGSILVGATDRQSSNGFHAVDAASGASLPVLFAEASADDVADACALAAAAAAPYAALAPANRAAFLEAIATEIEAIGDTLIATAMAETGLSRARLEGECGRTTGQLRLFAAEVREGWWLDATIDSALSERIPPRPDLRRFNAPLGPVAVFGASNFPLAFSAAGGDTASALAAGCPVVVKGHPAHPGTGELAARAIRAAVAASGLPEGTFSFLPGAGHTLGEALVADPRIKAVGFTGSRRGGLALAAIAAGRPEPIPVYAEMSSINPVILLEGALAKRAEDLGRAFAASLTMGSGQFCTNPGLVIARDGASLDRFIAAAAEALGAIAPGPMLTQGIERTFGEGVAALAANANALRVASGQPGDVAGRCAAALFETSAAAFTADKSLHGEIFGASSLVVRCNDPGEIVDVIGHLEGQLTATIHLTEADSTEAAVLLPLLAGKAGRVLANGWPTGVEVTHAMVHGGPFPATSDGRTTSVGTLAMMRFLRPICLQDIPDTLLPPPLQAANPWKLPRRIDGVRVLA